MEYCFAGHDFFIVEIHIEEQLLFRALVEVELRCVEVAENRLLVQADCWLLFFEGLIEQKIDAAFLSELGLLQLTGQDELRIRRAVDGLPTGFQIGLEVDNCWLHGKFGK